MSHGVFHACQRGVPFEPRPLKWVGPGLHDTLERYDPSETAPTLERLVKDGYSDFQARQLIGQAVVIEVIDALKNKKPYNEQRYIKNLRNLLKEPQE